MTTVSRLLKQALALGCSAAIGCGTEQIELRPQGAGESAGAGEPAAAPTEASPSSPAEPGGGAPSPVPGRDGVLGPAGQLPAGFDPPPAEPEKGCQKIDFLFVIDNSDSMEDEQQNLARSFPGFIQVMQQVLEAQDFHIMVVSTSGDEEDEQEPSLDAEACEEVRGAGRRQSDDGEDCGMPGGAAFMTESQPELEATFACAAQVGTDGSAFERPMEAMFAGTSAALNAPGRCNAGFLREDAILVVTLITDEDDDRSSGDPADWQRQLLEVKGGNDSALVVLGLVGDNNVEGGLLDGPCRRTDADGAPRLQELVDGVGGVLGSVCASDYTPFFRTAVGSIDSACEDFVPPAIF